MENRNPYDFNKNTGTSTIIGLVVMVLVFVALFFIAKGIFNILAFIAPVLVLITLLLDYKVILEYGKFIINLFKKNVVTGIIATLLTFFGFPFVAGFLFFKAIAKRQIGKMMEKHQRAKEEFTEYEEVEEEADFLELPEIEKPMKETLEDSSSEYDDLFK